jgi:predicted transcriptional regulator
MRAVKDTIIELAQALPEECMWDEVMERIYVLQKIERGLLDADEGRTISHEEVFREFEDDESGVSDDLEPASSNF